MACDLEWLISLLDGFELFIHVPAALIPRIHFIGEQVVKSVAIVTDCDQFTYWHHRLF
jgi:hypothetical protein